MVRAVIFDMDGTIIDTEKIKENGWKFAGSQLGIKIDDEILSMMRGTNKKYIEELLIEKFNNSFNFNVLYEIRKKYIQNHIDKEGIKMKDGLVKCLQYLKDNDYKIAVASSSDKSTILEYLKKINILKFFDVLIGGDMVKNGKPDSEIYLKVVELLGVQKEACIGVEDSINGVLSTYRAGIKPVMIPDLEYPTKQIENILYAKLNSLTDIINLLENYKNIK